MTIQYTQPELTNHNGMRCVRIDYKGENFSGSTQIITKAYSREGAVIGTKPNKIPQDDWDNLVKKSLELL